MGKRLKRRFIIITMGSLFLVFLILIASINLATTVRMEQQCDYMLAFITENNGTFPDEAHMNEQEFGVPHTNKFNEESRFKTRFFSILIDETSSEVVKTYTASIAAVSEATAQQYAVEILESGSTTGYKGYYKYLVTDVSDGTLIVFLDCNEERKTELTLFLISVIVAAICLLLVFVLIYFLSDKVIEPFVKNVENQKRFITDAGHEIKTPLAIISANTEVIEMTSGKSEWTESIHHQTNRLGDLVGRMLTLARLEEGGDKLKLESFSLSEITEAEIAGFDVLAASKGRTIDRDIESNVMFRGNAESIKQLVSILMENAIKYSEENTEVAVKLFSKGKNVILEVRNKTSDVDEKEFKNVFERFYRTDVSRSRETGGFGIGLSIAQSITRQHGGQISVRKEDGDIVCFSVVLPDRGQSKGHPLSVES